jgi:Fe-S cluster assembly protein SufB
MASSPPDMKQIGIDRGVVNREMFDQANEERFAYKAAQGLNEELIHKISDKKKEPEWMREHRLKSLRIFFEKPLPMWGADLTKLDLSKITYYGDPGVKEAKKWEDVPDDIKNTFEKLGIPKAERAYLAGAGAQYESEMVYHNLAKQWEDMGIIFKNCDVALQEHEDLFKKYFMKCVPPTDHKFAALHGAVWSGGTFLHVPEGVKMDMPVQAYFRMNAEGFGQFEHTLIVVEKDAQVHYIEGCSAPKWENASIHAGCVEVFVKEGARARYSSVENWSRQTYNLNTKRAIVEKNAFMEWVNGNLGSGVTMLYPMSVLKGENARSDMTGIAFAGPGQNQDTGSKVQLLAPGTSCNIVSKSLAMGGGITTYRGLVKVGPNAVGAKVKVECDALLLDDQSKNYTIPDMQIQQEKVEIAHEATVGKISTDQIFYLMSRGLTEDQAAVMIVNGFIEPITKELPLEYAVELNRLIELEMEGSIG